MHIIAAFRWDGSKDKSISFMIIDENCQLRHPPLIKKMGSKDLKTFKREADKVIQSFFAEIGNIHRANKGGNTKIEYKIVSNASPVSNYNTKMHKPSDRTEFVREKFHEYFEQANDGNGSLELAKQLKTNLVKPALNEFKDALNNLHIINKQRNNAYQYHLWALALHATKSTYKKELKKLNKALMPAQGEQKDKKKPRAA